MYGPLVARQVGSLSMLGITSRNERSTAVASSRDPFCMAYHFPRPPLQKDLYVRRDGRLHRTVWAKLDTRQSGSASALPQPNHSAAYVWVSDGKDGGPCACSPTAVPLQTRSVCAAGLGGETEVPYRPREVQPAHAHSRPSARSRGRVGLAAGCYRRSASPKVHHIEGLTLCLCLPVADRGPTAIWPGLI